MVSVFPFFIHAQISIPPTTLDFLRPQSQIPTRLKQLLDSKNVIEGRLYAYNNNFSFPIYGVKMTTTYNGRTVNDTPQNLTCYYLGKNDYVVMLIGESFTGAFIHHSNIKAEGYDVYESYLKKIDNRILYIGKDNNQNKVILKEDSKTNSGGTKTIRAEWTTNQAASNNAQSNGSLGNSYYMPSVPSQSGSSSSSNSTRRTCPACHGTGKGSDQIIYQPDYTGHQVDTYCSKCGKSGSPHTHNQPMCRACYGKGYIE